MAMTTTADVESEQTLLNKAPARPWKRLAAAAAAASFVLGLLAATAVISSPRSRGSAPQLDAQCSEFTKQKDTSCSTEGDNCEIWESGRCVLVPKSDDYRVGHFCVCSNQLDNCYFEGIELPKCE